MDGTITAEELARLQELMKKNGVELSDEEMKKMKEMRKQFGMLT